LPRQAQARILLSDIPNPFLQDRVDTPWQESFQDEPDINRTAFQSIQNSVKAVYQGNQSRGLILHGEPGSGKTHLLQRLRFFTQKDPRTWFIYIPPFPGPSRFWRHLLERFFYDICQRSKLASLPGNQVPQRLPVEEGPGQGPLTQIEEALTRHLLGKPLSSTQELARLWADICKQDQPGEPLFRRLTPTFNKLTVQFRLDPDVMKVIRHYLTWNNRAIAYAYLLGRDLPDEDLTLLGVKQSLDDEERAKQAITTFCRLAGRHFTILLAFDQIEGLQLTLDDLEGLRTFANNVFYLMFECQNLLILSAVQTYFIDTLKKSMHSSSYHRIAQDESVLTLLNRESAKNLVELRLRTQEEIAHLQKEDPKRGLLWPFTTKEIEQLVPIGGVSARRLIREARHRFDELVGLPPPPPPPAEAAISQHWNELFEKELQQPGIRLDEGVYEDGLLKILQVKAPKGYQVRRGTERDLQVILDGQNEKVGISVSNSENMTSLARHLGRLQAAISGGKVTRLIFLRDARLSIKPTATVTQQRLRELAQKGMQVIRPPAEAYAALNVLRELWNKAAENDLMVGDSPVSIGQLKSWLVEKTPRPLQELIDACQQAAVSLPEELADKLLEILTGQWIMPLKDAAQKMAVPETALAKLIIEIPEVAGLLVGPPAILFLNPEAVSRT
jgi:KaiC/GvpD/RAD55 family RecA-like ATPase